MLLVWLLLAALGLAVAVTYWRVPPAELYHVSRDGPAGGLSRALVTSNYPVALAAIGILGVLLERGAPRRAAGLAIACCAVTAVVVDQDDLDARIGNLVPFAGVLLAALLTERARPVPRLLPAQRFDRLRVVLAVLLAIVAVPWYFAVTGFFAPDPILADEPTPGEPLPAVHKGDHHGLDGAVLAATALILSRIARTRALRATLALMFVYGFANALEDAWLEQVVKRGWTDHAAPSVVVPSLSLAWALLLAASAALFVAFDRARARQ